MFKKACGNTILFPDYQVTRQRDLFCLPTKSINIVALRHIIIKLAYEHPTNPGTLLIDRVEQRIRHILDTL